MSPLRLEPRWVRQSADGGRIFAPPEEVAAKVQSRVPSSSLDGLLNDCRAASKGRIIAFGRSSIDYGYPIDWSLEPWSRERWPQDVPGVHLFDGRRWPGDIKLTWEVGRFPQAFGMARAAAFCESFRRKAATDLFAQILSFQRENPVGYGVQWASGFEVALRMFAWKFALDVFSAVDEWKDEERFRIHQGLFDSAREIAHFIEFAQRSVNNDHLIGEALALYLASFLFPAFEESAQWRDLGVRTLDQEAERQVYEDGAYLLQSHTYHRAVMQLYLGAAAIRRAERLPISESWLSAFARSFSFLVAHQNPMDGRLPNYGSNDGGHPFLLSFCDYADFRPLLQTLSLVTRGKRTYDVGPWDEEAAWWLGGSAVDAPYEPPEAKSVSFGRTGYHVLRGDDGRDFAAFRCGSLRDRFSQIDMLHFDVWWKGQNVLVDGGTYLYNGPEGWHNHFVRTASHNTVEIDGQEQMLHHRKFKVLNWTKAALLSFEDRAEYAIASGEHYGYQKQRDGCVHRRSILYLKEEAWIIVDSIRGTGNHDVRLHWLCGDFPHEHVSPSLVTLHTPEGAFCIRIFEQDGNPLSCDVVRGQNMPPRGWLSRYYAEKRPVPSISARRTGELPLTIVSVLGPSAMRHDVKDGIWRVECGEKSIEFSLADGMIAVVSDFEMVPIPVK